MSNPSGLGVDSGAEDTTPASGLSLACGVTGGSRGVWVVLGELMVFEEPCHNSTKVFCCFTLVFGWVWVLARRFTAQKIRDDEKGSR